MNWVRAGNILLRILRNYVSGGPRDVNLVLLGEFMIREDVKMYNRLPVYAYCLRFDLSNEIELSAISSRLSEGFAKPSWITLKHHLFNTHIPKNLFNAIRKLFANDKEDEFNQERSPVSF